MNSLRCDCDEGKNMNNDDECIGKSPILLIYLDQHYCKGDTM